MKVHYMGRLHDDISLAVLYSAADVMVVPSIRESFGQTASEAMACGTPVVAFGATGLLDIVDHKINGYLASPYESDDLENGIAWVLSLDDVGYKSLSSNARDKAEKAFSIELMARKYISLFRNI
jgi:glycosyltransferase involved in cell wall biosynthesis